MKTPSPADGRESLFQPDLVLPLQFFAGQKRKAAAGSERQLFLAILQDAVECFQKYLHARDVRGRRLWAEAEEWLLLDDRTWPFSFINVCEVLDIHPRFLRRGLLAWKEQSLARRPAGDGRDGVEPPQRKVKKRKIVQANP
jgi:hypothetical protein